MVTSNPFANNRHADVLTADPDDDAGKLRLCEEVKNRAKGAFQQKDMPSAEALYGKAISLLESVNGKAEAALYSNRSMVRLNLNKVEQSLEDAKKCIEVDPTFVKAYHRKAQALIRLNEWEDAIKAAQEGEKLDPSNKEFAKVIEKAEADKAKDAEDKAKLKRDAQDVRVELHNASTARAPPVKKEKKEGEEDNSMRGYKTTTDGKKTSYFHTEISQEAKELIAKQGFGKPQKLEAPAEAKEAKGGGSSWNQAGTYEEKGMSKWVEKELPEALNGKEFALPGDKGGKVLVTAITDIKGPATVTVARGKRKHIMDLSFEVEYQIQACDATGTGKLSYSEVTTDEDDDFEVKCTPGSDMPAALREVSDAFVKSGGTGLQPIVTKAIKDVIALFKTQ
jgi:tetratricopeptide (TPR) repeat protein